MSGKILNFGSLNIDYVYSLDHIVKEGETQASNGYQIFEGGKGLNQSVALARAGANVFHAGKIGKEGIFLKDALETSGVDCTYLSIDEGANGHAIIQRSKTGQNSIILYPGANHKITTEDIDKILDNFSQGDILVCQNEISQMSYLIKAAYNKGMSIAWNPSPVTDIVKEINFNMITWLIINEIEGNIVTGEQEPDQILQTLRTKYPNLRVVLTLGEDGAVYQDADIKLQQKRYTVPVKDTTAAGDTFLGYFINEVSTNPSNISSALQMASMAAALAVSKEGAMPSIPQRKEVISAL